MCGIFGHTNFTEENLDASRQALHTLKHRGPDQWNDWWHEGVYMGHRRLSIMDLSENGKQPMIDKDHGVAITVNGEIYNFKEIKKILNNKYNFRSNSDSEVVLYAYIEWGIDGLLNRIDGIFAISIYDFVKNKIYLVRDHVGVKPLYYSLINKALAWASELKSIMELYAERLPETDYTALYDYLTYLYIPAPKTPYKNIFKLEPATYIEFDLAQKSLLKKRYWTLNVNTVKINPKDASKRLIDLLRNQIKAQMMSDVPVGFFLSGGIDSSSVVALGAEVSNKIHTYSIGFENSTEDETPFAQLLAKRYKTHHHEEKLSIETSQALLKNMKEWFDEPFADTSALPTFLVSKFARKSATVVLTGDGGDELFGGYRWYALFEEYSRGFGIKLPFLKYLFSSSSLQRGNSLLSKATRQINYRFILSPFEIYAKLLGGMIHAEKRKYRKMWNIDPKYDSYWYFKQFYKAELPLKKRLQYLDFHTYLPDDILTKVDRVSMAVALECRVPLLGKDLVEFVFSLPEEIRLPHGIPKGLLKESMKGFLPEKILNKRKKGFSIPLKDWRKKIIGSYQNKQLFLLHEVFKSL